MTANKIRRIDPTLRLRMLQEYMSTFVNEYPYKYSFGEFIHKYYPYEIPDTPDYYKIRATNCYYCDCKLVDCRKYQGHPKRATVDHYEPKSKGKTDRYVICCAECNCKKGNLPPERVAEKLNRAAMKGQYAWGFGGAKLNFIAGRFQHITNDIIFNTGVRIYYMIKTKVNPDDLNPSNTPTTGLA